MPAIPLSTPPREHPAREEILSAEFTRSQPPGVRLFSIGILKLCRQLGLAIASQRTQADPNAPAIVLPHYEAGETSIIGWMLDESHSIEEVKRFAECVPAEVDRIVGEYEFTVSPLFLIAVQKELSLTNRAAEAALVHVVAKPPLPGAKPGPAPPPNS